MRDMKWNADGQRICIVYEDGKALSFSRFVSNACCTLEERAEQTALRGIVRLCEEISSAVSSSVRLSFHENFASRGQAKSQISNTTDIFLMALKGEKLMKTQPHK